MCASRRNNHGLPSNWPSFRISPVMAHNLGSDLELISFCRSTHSFTSSRGFWDSKSFRPVDKKHSVGRILESIRPTDQKLFYGLDDFVFVYQRRKWSNACLHWKQHWSLSFPLESVMLPAYTTINGRGRTLVSILGLKPCNACWKLIPCTPICQLCSIDCICGLATMLASESFTSFVDK